MAASFRPFLNDVSAGAISPKLYGRQNSELYARGASALDNMFPDRFGQAGRRGALELIAEVTGSSTHCRLIPWSVSDSIDLLLVVTDGHIQAFDCSAGHTMGFVSGFDVTEIKAGHPVYSGASIHEVNYAMGNGSMYLAHRDYPLFSIRMVSYSGDPATFTFEYGAVELEGSIAYTPEIEEENSAQGDFLSTALLCSALGSLPTPNVAVAVTTGYINNHPVASVVKNIVSTPRKCSCYVANFWGAAIINDNNIMDGTDRFPNPWTSNDIKFWIAKSRKSTREVSGYLDRFTKTGMLEAISYAGLAENVDYVFCCTPPLSLINEYGVISWRRGTSSTSFTINFSDGTPAMTITPSSPNMIGFLKIDAYGIDINKNTVGGAAALDCVAPWMVPNTAYRCDNSKLFYGIYPLTAVKNESAKQLDSYGVAIAEGFNSITITGSTEPNGRGTPATREVYRNTIVTGQLGVIVNPFAYGAGRYPAFVAFHNGRMVVGGSKDEPNVLYLSKVNDFTNFCYFDEIEYEQNTIKPKPWSNPSIPEYNVKKAITQQIGHDSAMRLQLLTDESEALRWAASMGDLVIGTATSEWIIPGGSTAHNARAVLISRNGSSHIQGRFVRGSIMFAQGDGRALKMFENSGGEVSSAISDHAEHLFRAGGALRSFDFRQTPVYGVIAVKESGDAIYGVIGQNSIGFSPFYTRSTDSIESMVAIPLADEDAVFAVVKRHTPSGSKRFLEKLLTMPEDGTVLELAHLDGRRYSASTGASGTVAGLDDFFGEASCRIVFANGRYGAPIILANGSCSSFTDEDNESATYGTEVANPVNTAFVIGYRYLSRYRTMRIDSVDTEGLVKSPGAIRVRVYKSGDWRLERQRAADPSPVLIPRPVDESGARIYPYSGSIRVENPSGAGADQYVEIATDSHEPLVIQAVVPYYEVGEEV